MRTVVLFRHAKSSWELPLADFDRPLAPRGRKAAPAMARWLEQEGELASWVLCSPAARTRATWKLLRDAWSRPPTVLFDPALYEAAAPLLLERFQEVPDRIERAMLIGHNPSLLDLGLLLARPTDPLLGELRAKFPTAAACVLRVAITRWRDLEPECGEIALFQKPRELEPMPDRSAP